MTDNQKLEEITMINKPRVVDINYIIDDEMETEYGVFIQLKDLEQAKYFLDFMMKDWKIMKEVDDIKYIRMDPPKEEQE